MASIRMKLLVRPTTWRNAPARLPSERAMLKMWKRNAAIVRENLKTGQSDASQ